MANIINGSQASNNQLTLVKEFELQNNISNNNNTSNNNESTNNSSNDIVIDILHNGNN